MRVAQCEGCAKAIRDHLAVTMASRDAGKARAAPRAEGPRRADDMRRFERRVRINVPDARKSRQ
jgi:hypothetical protein